MIINTESVVGYNNNLRRATDDMKLGVNNHVNQGTKKASLRLMAGGPSKVNQPNSHPANPVHKQATEAQGIAPAKAPHATTATSTPTSPPHATTDKPAVVPPQTPGQVATQNTVEQPTNTTAVEAPVDTHHVNKALVVGGVLALAGFIAWLS